MTYVYKVKCVYETEIEIEADNNEDAESNVWAYVNDISYDGTVSNDWEWDLLNVCDD